LIVALFGIACGFCSKVAAQVSSAADASLAQEANRLSDELSKQGFLVPYVVLDGPKRFELFVASQDTEHVISLWFATAQGTVAIELRDPKEQPLASWRGTRGKLHLEKKLDPGKYQVDVQEVDGAHVHGVIGVKGRATGRCDADDKRLMELSPDKEGPQRYSWPYLLVKPAQLAAGGAGTLLVVPNNTGFPSDAGELLRASAICELGFGAISGPLAIADGLGAALLMPPFPRTEQLYLQALTRASLKQDIEPKFNRVDKQLIAMIDDARAKLAAMNYPVQPRVLMAGFSASGVFTNRFAVLHPERVLAAAVGGPGGWPIAPVRADRGKTLPYPVGIADLDNEELGGQVVDLAALQRVHFLFLLGDGDTNDAVPCRDSFSNTQADLINSLFGTVGRECGKAAETVVKRWWAAQRLYNAAGLNAQFRLYPAVDHEMGMTPVMWNDVFETFRKALSAR